MKDEIKYLNNTIHKYLTDLASNIPTPGGGSAAALVAATGVSCLLMVANFTIGKKGYEQNEEEVKKIIAELTPLKEELQNCIDKDVLAYNEVKKAYLLPKDNPSLIETRNKQIQIALENAANVAYKIMELSHKAIMYSETLLKIGNKNLVTDIACGAIFLLAAIQSAKYNVLINLKDIQKNEFVKKTREQVRRIFTDSKIITKKILQKIII